MSLAGSAKSKTYHLRFEKERWLWRGRFYSATVEKSELFCFRLNLLQTYLQQAKTLFADLADKKTKEISVQTFNEDFEE